MTDYVPVRLTHNGDAFEINAAAKDGLAVIWTWSDYDRPNTRVCKAVTFATPDEITALIERLAVVRDEVRRNAFASATVAVATENRQAAIHFGGAQLTPGEELQRDHGIAGRWATLSERDNR